VIPTIFNSLEGMTLFGFYLNQQFMDYPGNTHDSAIKDFHQMRLSDKKSSLA